MKILVITPYLPYPDVPHGGGQDLFALIRFLGERHAVSVASFADDAQAAHADALRPYVDTLTVIRPAITLRQKIARVGEIIQGKITPRADAQMRTLIRSTGADVLYAAWTEMGRYLDQAPRGCVRVLDEVDVRFIVEKAAGPGDPARKEAELAYCRAADLVATRSARDLAALRAEIEGLRGLVLPPVGHAAEFTAITAGERHPKQVLFLGAMNRRRNQQAARWLLGEIWPRVLAMLPEARLRIAGVEPPPDILEHSGKEGVEVTGWVDDLRGEYAAASVVVAPMRSEAGALNKVIDALAAGRPVVATRAANAGVGAPPDAIALADDADTFAREVAGLLRDEGRWRAMAEAGRRFAAHTFDWRAAAAALEANLLELVSNP